MRRVFRFGVGMPLVCLLAAGCATRQPVVETVYDWRTLAGMPGGLGNVDGVGAAARFCQPCGVAFDAAGNAYVADYYNYAIRKVARDGCVTTIAGCVGESGYADGAGGAARFDRPLGIAADDAGNLYVADSGSHTVRKISVEGVVTTLAGRAGDQGSADGTGRDARFRTPSDVAVDRSGNVFVADAGNHVIRKISSSGTVSTWAGKAELKSGVPVGGYANGTGSAARFRNPRALALDGAGNLYVADTDNAVIRKITSGGVVTTLAGGAGNAGYANGVGAAARFSSPQALAADAKGNLYVADSGNRTVRKVLPNGAVTNALPDGVRFSAVRGVAMDRAGNLLVADNEAQTLTLITPGGAVSVLAGSAGKQGYADGSAETALFNRPCGVTVDCEKRLTVTENFNHAVRAVASDGTVTTFAGRGGVSGYADGTNAASRFSWPSGSARDVAGNVYVADAGNCVIRKVAPDGTVTTLAGSPGNSGSADGTGDKARFSWPADVACDAWGNVYVADRGNHAVRKVTSAGAVTTVAGSAGKAGQSDGVAAVARFNGPSGVAVDGVGNVYVADTGNHTVRRIVPGGEVATVAGCAGVKGAADGVGPFARFNGPAALAVDADGNLIVADRDNHMIRLVTPAGTVTTLGGLPNVMDAVDGIGRAARFAQPSGVAVGADGCIYVADACNNRIAVGTPFVVKTVIEPKRAARTMVPPVQAVEPKTERYVWSVWAGQPGEAGSIDGRGADARLSGPQGVCLADDGSLYVACGGDGTVRRVSPAGDVSTVAASLRAPVAIGVGREGAAYVSGGDNALWRVDIQSGAVRLLAGASGKRGYADGKADVARFDFVPGLAVDLDGRVCLADGNNQLIRRVSRDGAVSTLAGRAGNKGCFDGVGENARFLSPAALAAGPVGTLFVADGDRIRAVSPQGAVKTVVPQGATFGRLDGVAVDRKGTLYVADRGRHSVWKVSPDGAVVKVGGSEAAMGGSGWLVTGMAIDRSGNLYVADSVRHCIMKAVPCR